MKKNLIASLVALTVISSSAFASDGEVRVTGNVTASTCTIDGQAAGSASAIKNVSLASAAATALNAAGKTAGQTAFSLALAACPANTSVSAGFEFVTGNVVAATGNLLNTGTAGNVQVQLLNGSDGSPIVVSATTPNSTAVTTNAAGAATLPFFARYLATGAATAGTVIAKVTYSIMYP